MTLMGTLIHVPMMVDRFEEVSRPPPLLLLLGLEVLGRAVDGAELSAVDVSLALVVDDSSQGSGTARGGTQSSVLSDWIAVPL